MKVHLAIAGFMLTTLFSCSTQEQNGMSTETSQSANIQVENTSSMGFNVQKSDSEWRESLSQAQYNVLREKGTERPFTGEYNLHFQDGVYTCAGCGAELFSSESKFESHCGWPSFDRALDSNTVVEILDKSHGMIRTEIVCANCGGHLGHVFNDGPTETGMRYCINSVSLGFESDSTAEEH